MAPGFEMEGDDNDYGIQKVDRKVYSVDGVNRRLILRTWHGRISP